MSETQQTVGEWIARTFPGTDPESPRKSLRALEEMLELCVVSGASLRDLQETTTAFIVREAYTGEPDVDARARQPHKIAAEAADVLIVLLGVAHMCGFDLLAEVDKKMAVNRSRVWAARGDGTGYHVPQKEQDS